MSILYVAAEAAELKFFASSLEGLRKLKWPLDYAFEGILDGRRILVAANGAGPKLAAQAVEVALRAVSAAELSSSKLEGVVSTGFCGALDPALRECQVIIGTSVVDSTSKNTFECAPISPDQDDVATGPVLSQDRIAGTAREKHALQASGAIAVDMEAGGVASRTKRAGLPFYCIKVVSDRADESFEFDLNTMRTSEGRIARGKIIVNTLRHPGLLPGLYRLKRRSADAAKALGEFLVSCRVRSESDSALAG
jgi:adenosylhomocysteine nucleosidase